MSDKDEPDEMRCPNCEGAMARVRTVPKMGGFPELRSYRCTVCRGGSDAWSATGSPLRKMPWQHWRRPGQGFDQHVEHFAVRLPTRNKGGAARPSMLHGVLMAG